MKDVRPDNISSDFGTGLNPRTLKLIDLLNKKSKSQSLANMLRGAWVVLGSGGNTDKLAQAAHSIRELIEKAPERISGVPVQSKSIKKLKKDKRKHQMKSLVARHAGNDGRISENLLEAQTNAIWVLRDYFITVSHHGKEKETTINGMKQNIINLENILLNLLNPQPINDLENLDRLIEEGESM